MNDADVERLLTGWLKADAAVMHAPAHLRERIGGIPFTKPARSSGWHRFTVWAAKPAMVAVAAIGVVVAINFFNVLDRPPGAEGETCNNRQLQQALDHLRDSAGYRYVRRQEHQIFDPEAEVSIEDPVYIWVEAYVASGAYLAPDRAHERVTFVDRDIGDPGYEEHLQIGGQTWQLRIVDGERTWVRLTTPWPTANMAYGYIQGSVSQFPLPGVSTLRFGEVPVPDGLPGQGGCTAAKLVPETGRVVAIRVDIGSQQVTATYDGPASDARGAFRTTFEIISSVPEADEFPAQPAEYREEDLFATPAPTPIVTPAPPDPNAWPPVELPNPAEEGGSAGIAAGAAGDDRFVAVGSQYPPGVDVQSGWSAVVWTSVDGREWELLDGPDGFAEMTFSTVTWDGTTFMALGYRRQAPAEDGTYVPDRPESWSSTDGLTWEQGGLFEAGANVGSLVRGGPGWVTTGSIWTGNEQRPAVFTSRDGSTWTTRQPEEFGFGSVRTVEVAEDGSLRAVACETPELTNTAPTSPCLLRPWLSDDGIEWTTGPIIDAGLELSDISPVSDGYVAIGYDPAGGFQTLYRSPDGEEWTRVSSFPAGPEAHAESVTVLDDGLLVEGSIMTSSGYPSAGVWESTDGETWESVGLAVPEGAIGSFVEAVVEGPAGVLLLGGVQLDETHGIPVMWLEP
jgi:hypothetical protein